MSNGMEYKALYEWGVGKLEGACIEEAALDARLLLEECCGTDRNYLLVHGNELVTDEQYESYVNYIEKRGRHIPLQHILGWQEFMGLKFKVNGDVLIPRQDTETLVEEVLRYLHDGMHILDMCTGSGCILLSLLRYSNDCMGVGCDISEKAINMAWENAKSLGLEAQFLKSNLFENIDGKYEIIVSNPPYIPRNVIPTLMEEVRDYDPVIALDGGEDGLNFYRQIIPRAGEYLYPGGMLFLETGCGQAADVKGMMERAGYKDVTVCKDLAGHDRVVSGRFGG